MNSSPIKSILRSLIILDSNNGIDDSVIQSYSLYKNGFKEEMKGIAKTIGDEINVWMITNSYHKHDTLIISPPFSFGAIPSPSFYLAECIGNYLMITNIRLLKVYTIDNTRNGANYANLDKSGRDSLNSLYTIESVGDINKENIILIDDCFSTGSSSSKIYDRFTNIKALFTYLKIDSDPKIEHDLSEYIFKKYGYVKLFSVFYNNDLAISRDLIVNVNKFKLKSLMILFAKPILFIKIKYLSCLYFYKK